MAHNWAAIRYRDFWDVPRMFVTQYRSHWFLFDCAFDEEAEDFPHSYKVSLITPPREDELTGSWKDLPQRARRFLGEVAVDKVEFDPTKRQAIDTTLLEELTAAIGV
jgi:hypothetical protein